MVGEAIEGQVDVPGVKLAAGQVAARGKFGRGLKLKALHEVGKVEPQTEERTRLFSECGAASCHPPHSNPLWDWNEERMIRLPSTVLYFSISLVVSTGTLEPPRAVSELPNQDSWEPQHFDEHA